MKKFILLIIIISICGCGVRKDDFTYKKVDNEEMFRLMDENEYIILDVRTNLEYQEEHIKDAINIPLDEIDGVSLKNDKIIFVYCASGGRSKEASLELIKAGYLVYDLGGMNDIFLPKE